MKAQAGIVSEVMNQWRHKADRCAKDEARIAGAQAADRCTPLIDPAGNLEQVLGRAALVPDYLLVQRFTDRAAVRENEHGTGPAFVPPADPDQTGKIALSGLSGLLGEVGKEHPFAGCIGRDLKSAAAHGAPDFGAISAKQLERYEPFAFASFRILLMEQHPVALAIMSNGIDHELRRKPA
jgi:hypothetical protein